MTITGGPGTSGISAADGYADAWPATIPEHFDIVFIDQRGVGLSRPIGCPEATAVYYGSTLRPADPAQADAAGAAAKTYVADCLSESKVDPRGPAATTQPGRPWRISRRSASTSDADTLHLYGESYGTQYVQTYAASHPDRIATLYLDGPVDLTLDAANYYGEAVRSFDSVLVAMLNACAAEASCAADFGARKPLAAYDELAARLAAGPVSFAFPMGDGTTQRRTLTSADLENAVVSYLYSPGERSLVERSLAAAADGNLVPLARLGYASIALDPDTLKVVPDPTWSDAMYYAVECQDYVFDGGAATDAGRLAAYLAQARALGVNEARLGSLYYGDMPCLYWPNRPAADQRPAPIVAAPYKTIVMVATTDPITPVANAVRIANRLTNVHTIIETGGPHVIFGWGHVLPGRRDRHVPGEGNAAGGLAHRVRRVGHGRVRPAGEGARPRPTRTRSSSRPRSRTRCSTRTTTGTASTARRSRWAATSAGRSGTTRRTRERTSSWPAASSRTACR